MSGAQRRTRSAVPQALVELDTQVRSTCVRFDVDTAFKIQTCPSDANFHFRIGGLKVYPGVANRVIRRISWRSVGGSHLVGLSIVVAEFHSHRR